MNIIYFIKEIYYKLFYFFIFSFTQIIIINYYLNYYYYFYTTKYYNKNITTNYLFEIFNNKKKMKWIPLYKEKIINHIEFYTLETITYKLILFTILQILFVYLFFFIYQWIINIIYYKKRTEINLYFIVYFLYYLYNIQNISNSFSTNTKYETINYEKIKYFNFYLEPQITTESIIDTYYFFFFLNLLKLLLILLFHLKIIKNKLINKILIFIFISLFFHVDIFFFFFFILELELLLFFFKFINIYTQNK